MISTARGVTVSSPVLDAASCLAQLLVDGMPDHERFHTVIGGTLDAAERAGYSRIRVSGEMVDILRGASLIATSRLEEFWMELLATRRMTLLCGYSIDIFDPQVYGGLLQGVCAAHSAVIPGGTRKNSPGCATAAARPTRQRRRPARDRQ